ncbi:MAG: CRISPR-associated endonuclease Cas2 [Draconibacterium sp.]|nr:CRISPR-associated endonuclease Cas2 [Draconibacterium sp.]
MKKKRNLTFVEKIKLIHRAGLEGKTGNIITPPDNMESLDQRIKIILEITTKPKLNAGDMLYFIMYDIENNKIRTLIAKYLIKKGCQRVQKSIFFAESPRDVYNQIVSDLKEVQETYENNDSIFFVPVSTDQLRAMKILGQNIDFDIIAKNRNTLFF